MKLPKMTKWAPRATNPAARGCLASGQRARTLGGPTGGGADISGVIYHRARETGNRLEKLPGAGPGTGGERETDRRKRAVARRIGQLGLA